MIVSKTSWSLRTFELWAYHVDGGKGLQISKSKPDKDTPASSRDNALGAVYSPDGRYLYYANRNGGFGYNLTSFPWQVVRRDLRDGSVDRLTQALGGGVRPAVSPDGRWLVYGTRHAQQTGLRIRELATGDDRWLVHPVQRDAQESRFTRDLLPGYAFTPDSRALLYTQAGGLRRIALATGAVAEIPFTAEVDQALGPRLEFPYRLGLGPVKARLIQGPALSPDGRKLAFSAFARLYVYDLDTQRAQQLSPAGVQAFHPSWSPDGRSLAYVTWRSDGGGHIWRIRANGGRPRQLSEHAAYYTDPAWSPDGKRIVALRAASYDRLYRESDFGAPVGADLVWIPAQGGAPNLIVPSRGLTAPHFSADPERIYLYVSSGPFPSSGSAGLVSMRYDGSDRRQLLTAKGPGIYNAQESVPAADIRLSPDGTHVLLLHANQLYVVALLNRHLADVTVELGAPGVPLMRLTEVGADEFGWLERDGALTIYWTAGHHLYQRPLASVNFASAKASDESGNGAGGDGEVAEFPTTADLEALGEAHPAVTETAVEVYLPRHMPTGSFALVGGTLLSMEPGAEPLPDATVVGDRWAHRGSGPV